MWSAILTLIKSQWKSLLLAGVVLACGMWLGTALNSRKLAALDASFATEKLKWAEEREGFASERTAWQTTRANASTDFARQLLQANQQSEAFKKAADDLTIRLARQQRESAATVKDLKKRLEDALKNDGAAYTGIGPAGMQLYLEALGYAGTAGGSTGNSLSATARSAAADTGHAGATSGGLSASGVITSAASYGQWCLGLRNQLQAIRDYYNR